MSIASSAETNLEGIHNMFALLCNLAKVAISEFQQIAALTFFHLLDVIDTPLPDPHRRTPIVSGSLEIFFRYFVSIVWVIDRFIGVGAQILNN